MQGHFCPKEKLWYFAIPMKEEIILNKLGIKTLEEWTQAALGKRRINGSVEIQRSLYSMLLSNRQHLPLKDTKQLNK